MDHLIHQHDPFSSSSSSTFSLIITTYHLKAHIDLNGLPSCIRQLQCSLRHLEKRGKATRKRNMVVVREREHAFTYTIFPGCGYINVANIKSWKHVENIIPSFAATFDIEEQHLANRLIVDNSSNVVDWQRPINIIALEQTIAQLDLRQSLFPESEFELVREVFPGGFFKTKQKGTGTIVIHGTGKCLVMGATGIDRIKVLCQFITRLAFATSMQ